eukprot:comp4997_c0_seq1/m.1089 comp4997_c0_seq1/g.1089  ORF comp4997_c0_seq1/g.1089 comp4997_c0_seq1/m.1089 type:complete len:449 (-) comp4997_c0_seq1:18-1364(-)
MDSPSGERDSDNLGIQPPVSEDTHLLDVPTSSSGGDLRPSTISDAGKSQAGTVLSPATTPPTRVIANELMIAVFVVAFDTKEGQIVEWVAPAGMDLCGIEFQCMPSGLHRVDTDFTYFTRQGGVYGLSVYGKMKSGAAERGARMKAVGLLCTQYECLHRHFEFLSQQIWHVLETGDYSALQAYFIRYQFDPFKIGDGLSGSRGKFRNLSQSGAMEPVTDMVMHSPYAQPLVPAGSLVQCVQYFGPVIFTLWKLMLMQKRVLLYAPPPVGPACLRVYVLAQLGRLELPFLPEETIRPLFHVGLHQMDLIGSMDNYVACTTDQILEEKRHRLCDVLSNQQTLTFVAPAFPFNILRITNGDKARYAELMALKGDEGAMLKYFADLNTRLFARLFEASTAIPPVLTREDLKDVGLSNSEISFAENLCAFYDINVKFDRGVGVCPCSSLCGCC